MMHIQDELRSLNFSANEAKVYLTLVQLGPCLAGRIAKEASLDRSSTYNALKMLVERGIVSTTHENKRTTYIPADPKQILDYFEEKKERAKKIIPELQKQFAFKREKKNIVRYEGFKGVKTVFQDILHHGKDGLLILGSEGRFQDMMPWYVEVFRNQKERAKIQTKMLIREGRGKTKKKGKYTEYRLVPSDVISPVAINIYGDRVAIFIWDEKPEALLIENSGVAQTFRNYYNFMWKNAKTMKATAQK